MPVPPCAYIVINKGVERGERQIISQVDNWGQTGDIGSMSKKVTIRTSEVKRLSTLQCTAEEIATFFGITVKKWRSILEADEVIRDAFNQGQTDGKLSLRRKQFRLAGDNASMAIHLGKQYLGQHDKSQVELSGPGGGPVETFDYSKLDEDERASLRKTLTRAVRS